MTPLAPVETKFFLPRARDGAVARPRLDEQLGRGSRLTLVSAPAGFGKTTLVGTWVSTFGGVYRSTRGLAFPRLR